jgi:hypothetical protein
MRDDPEILVHVAAPGGARDDARYRSQVQAFLAFEPVSRQSIFCLENGANPESISEETVASFRELEGDETSVHSGDELRNVLEESSYPPGVNQREAALESRDRESKRRDGGNSLNSTHVSPVSTISGDNAPNWVPAPHSSNIPDQSQHPHPPLRSHTFPGDPVSPRERAPLSTAVLRRSFSESSSFDTPLSVIPDSQPRGPNSGSYSESGDQLATEQVQVVRSFSSEPLYPSKRCRVNNAGPAAAVAEADNARIPSSLPSSNECATSEKQTEIYNQESDPVRSTNTVQHKSSGLPDLKRQAPPRPDHTISLSVLPIEIHPPPPPISTDKFQTHITPTLQMLAERMKLPRKFQPAKQNRELQPLERGYWFLQMNVIDEDDGVDAAAAEHDGKRRDQDHRSLQHQQSEDASNNYPPSLEESVQDDTDQIHDHSHPNDWSFPFFCQFWSFLTDFISRDGRAGWGVWCILEEKKKHNRIIPEQTTEEEQQQPHQNLRRKRRRRRRIRRPLTMKIYSWGEVAPHVYMLLFLATERRIRGMRAQWIDAAESVVIEMP